MSLRLLHATDLTFEEFVGDQIPKYAIISHRWTNEEVSYQDFLNDRSDFLDGSKRSYGWTKIHQAGKITRARGLEWFWLDSCCIDKKSSAELSEAINSMFSWYKQSAECYVFLSDVHDIDSRSKPPLKRKFLDDQDDFEQRTHVHREQFRGSAWFTRSWTLQELLAPHTVEFFNADFRWFASRDEEAGLISRITGIPQMYLAGITGTTGGSGTLPFDISKASVAERMRWASSRKATRKEDVFYSLLGIFGINMPLLYGEGDQAFLRLQTEIVRKSMDETIFAWSRKDYKDYGILASSLSAFSRYRGLHYSPLLPRQHYEVTNKGVRMLLPLRKLKLASMFEKSRELVMLLRLNCIVEVQSGPDARAVFLMTKIQPERAFHDHRHRSFYYLLAECTGLSIHAGLSTAATHPFLDRPDIVIDGSYTDDLDEEMPVYFHTGW